MNIDINKITLGVEDIKHVDIRFQKILYNNSNLYLKLDILSFRKLERSSCYKFSPGFFYIIKISQEDITLLERIRNKICEYYTINPFTNYNENTLAINKWSPQFEKYGFCITTRLLISKIYNKQKIIVGLHDIRELIRDQAVQFLLIENEFWLPKEIISYIVFLLLSL